MPIKKKKPASSPVRRPLLSFGVVLGGIAGLALVATVALLLEADEIYRYSDTFDGGQLPEVDAIVCLAGGRGRISAAGDLWFRYWEQASRDGDSARAPLLYLSGMGERANWNTVKAQVRPGVLQALTSDQVVVETESSNTVENALWLSRYAHERGWRRILLMTSRYHMKRAWMIFERFLAPNQEQPGVEIETLSVYQEPFEPGEWREDSQGVRVTVTEYLKYLYYRQALGYIDASI